MLRVRSLKKGLVVVLKSTGVLFLLLFATASKTSAQTQVGTADVTFNVILANFSSISIASASQTATLNYDGLAAYNSGVTLSQTKALNVKSLLPFTVKVYATADLTDGNSNTLPAADFTVKATPNPAITGITAVTTAQAFPNTSAGQVAIINATVGILSSDFDLTYAGPGSTGTPNSSDFLGKPAGTYTTTVRYVLYQN